MTEARSTDLTRRDLLMSTAAAATVPLLPPDAATGPFTSQPAAWDLFVRGAQAYRRYTPDANRQARALFEEALATDPTFARATASLSATHRQDWTLLWSTDPAWSLAEAHRLAQRAVALARQERPPQPSLPHTLEQWAYVLTYSADHQAALAAAQEAVTVQPDYADGWTVWAHALTFAGQPDEALDKTRQAMRLSPTDPHPFFYDYHLGHAYYVKGALTGERDAYEQAEGHLRECLRKNPSFRPPRTILAAVLWERGRHTEAGQEMATMRAMGRMLASEDPPAFRAYVTAAHPYAHAAILERLIAIWTAAEAFMESV